MVKITFSAKISDAFFESWPLSFLVAELQFSFVVGLVGLVALVRTWGEQSKLSWNPFKKLAVEEHHRRAQPPRKEHGIQHTGQFGQYGSGPRSVINKRPKCKAPRGDGSHSCIYR
jgi:hypothetical protein